MERLNESMAQPAQQGQRGWPVDRTKESGTRLPVGAFLAQEDEDQNKGSASTLDETEEDQERAPVKIPPSRLPRPGGRRVVEGVPPGSAGTRHLATIPPPREAHLPPVSDATSACPICKGAGYLRADVPVGHPDFGKPLACKCKQARRNEARRRLLREQSQIDRLEAFREASFETFQLLLPGVQEAYEVALAFAQVPHGWLVFEGPNGCGKTHLAVSIARRCLEDGAMALFAVVPDLLDYLRATFAPDAEEHYDDAFMKMRETELLVLDDLGAEQSTPWANEKLFQLLNYRYNGRLATVITTNKIGFTGIENRIRSRLSDTRLVRVVTLGEAQDFRPRAGQALREQSGQYSHS